MDSKKALMIVDPQVDFVYGSLPVGGASEVMNELADYIAQNPEEYRLVIITVDNHPANHCSFKENGGEWPSHCVARSNGASVVPQLQKVLKVTNAPQVILAKGECSEVEEYSIFKNSIATQKIVDLIRDYGIEQIDVCGIAGDVCVYNTLTDAFNILKEIKIKVLKRFCASIDGGERLNQMPDEIVLKPKRITTRGYQLCVMNKTIKTKRAYDAASADDGFRIYVDRLWPRGLSHETFHYDLWDKEIAPSTELREWFHANPQQQWSEFERRYAAELQANPALAELKALIADKTVVTLLYSSRDELHNNALVLRNQLIS